MPFSLTSPAFGNNQPIPRRHAKEGANRSPALGWTGLPAGTRSLALVVEDPDAPQGTFRHWAVFDIPADRCGLEEGASLAGFGRGINDYGTDTYEGPNPPRGHGIHHYHFRLAALGVAKLGLAPGVRVIDVWEKAREHLLDEARLTGTYER